MSLQDLGAIGELIGAAAVVITLLYLVVQVRQNTRTVRSSASFSLNQALAEINGRWVSNDDGFTDLWLRGCADLASLNPVEHERFSRHSFDLLNLAVFQYEAEKNDLVDIHIDFIAYLSFLVQSNPGLRQFVLDLGGPFFASADLYERILGLEPRRLDPSQEVD